MGLFGSRKVGPEGLTLKVTDTFFVALNDKGAVAMGQLEGDGMLKPKDVAIIDGQEWPVIGLEGFKKQFKEAGAGTNVGVVFGTGAPKEFFDGKTLTFRSG